jgi:hypothetical protein
MGLRAGHDVTEKNLFPLPGIEPGFLGRPARSLVTIPRYPGSYLSMWIF